MRAVTAATAENPSVGFPVREFLALALPALALAAETRLMPSATGTTRHASYVQVFEPDQEALGGGSQACRLSSKPGQHDEGKGLSESSCNAPLRRRYYDSNFQVTSRRTVI
jgi:hypothetical protein